MLNQRRLVPTFSGQLGAVNARKQVEQLEVGEDPSRVDMGLRRRDAKPMTGLAEPKQGLGYARVDGVLEHPDLDEALPVEGNSAGNQLRL
jgi:hypothetical protein